MSNNTSIVTIPEDLKHEFTIDEDGKAYASFRAVARLCGTHSSGSSIADLLRKVALSKTASETLKPLVGMDYNALSVPGKGIPDAVVSFLIQHFAYSTYVEPETQQTARKTLGAFIAVGIRAWLQHELGWKPQEYKLDIPQVLRDYASLLEAKERVKSSYPGLDSAHNECSRELLPVPELPRNFHLRDWLAYKHIYLDRSDKISLGNFIASTIERDCHIKLSRSGAKHRSQVIRYNQQHLPLIEEAFKAWKRRGGQLKTQD